MDFDVSEIRHLLTGHQYKWICSICLIPAQSGVILEYQYIEHCDIVVYSDTDGQSWLRCIDCFHSFHARCVTCLSDAEIHIFRSFKCCGN